MNVVLYTRELEPITVVDIPIDAIRFAQKRGRLVLAVMDPIAFDQKARDLPVRLRTVGLEFVPLRYRDAEGWLALVDDETNALAIEPGWLPGQQVMLNRHAKVQRMLMDALFKLMGHESGGDA